MSYEELDRVRVIERVIERRLRQREAARMLGLTSRQVRRLRRAYERDGPEGLESSAGNSAEFADGFGRTLSGSPREG